MKNNKNNKNKNTFIKSILSFFLIFSFMLISGNAAIFSDDQEQNLYDLGLYSIVSEVGFVQLNNQTLSEVYKIIMTTTKSTFVFTSASGNNESIKFSYNDGLGFVENTYNVIPGENLYLTFEPQVVEDSVDILITEISGEINYELINFNDDNRGSAVMGALFTPLVDGIKDLILINITMWKTLYYIFVAIVGILLIMGLFTIAMKIIDYTKSINNKKGFMSNERGE